MSVRKKKKINGKWKMENGKPLTRLFLE